MSVLSIGELLDMGGSASTTGLVPYSALEYNASGAISGISGSAIAGGIESSVVSSIVSSMVSGKADQSALENCCSSMSSVVSSIQTDVSSISSFVSGITGDYLEKSASSMFAPSGDYAYNSSLSSYLYASASSNFQPSGNYQTAGDYAYNSAVSSKLDASASSQFVVDSSLYSYVAYSAIGGEDSHITSISGSAIGGSIPPTTQLILDDATMSGLIDPLTQDFYIGVKSGVFASDSGMTAYATKTYVDSSVSSKLYESAFTSYTATSIPIVIVGNSSEATAANVVYVVTGAPE